VLVYIEKTNDGIQFGVKDSGIGMTSEQQRLAFEAFTQADNSHTRKYGGTGLGLPICATLVGKMGGTLEVKSKPNQGSEFYFQLPLDAVLPAESDDFSGINLLLVEDNLVNQEVAKEILTSAGFNVEICDNGKHALEIVQKQNFDLVLMDIQMPVMDGIEASKNIRDLGGEYLDLPIISMTAHALTGDKDKSLQAGMNDHITKPIEPEKLFQVIGKWMAVNKIDNKNTEPKIPVESSSMLPTLPGIDIDDGLQRVCGNWSVYKSILLAFEKTQLNIDIKIESFIDNKEFSDAEMLAHTIKGSSGNIGAITLYKMASELEKACHNKDAKALNLSQHMSIELKKVLDGINEMNQHEDKACLTRNSGQKLSPAQLSSLLNELLEHLNNDLSKAQDTFEKLFDPLESSEIFLQLKDLELALNTFNTDDAIEILMELKSSPLFIEQ